MDGSRLDRRAFTSGFGAISGVMAGLISAPALAQVVASPFLTPPTPPPPIEDEARLIANLFTRMSTRTAVNGHDQTFVLDTGAGCTAIAEDVARALALPPGPSLVVHGVTSAEVAPTVIIRRLIFGGRRFNGVHAAVFPRDLLAADGLLGLDVLSRFKLDFDLRRHTMMLKPSGSDVIEFGQAFTTPTRMRRGEGMVARVSRFGQLILPNIRANGIATDSFIDSGAQYSIGNMALFRAIGGLAGPTLQRALTPIYGVTGQTLFAERGQIADLQVNHYRLGATPLFFADLHAFEALGLTQGPALLIGADLLYRFQHVSLDFGESRVAFGGLRRSQRS